MKESSRFWDRMAVSYAKKPVTDKAIYEKKLEITRHYLRPDMELLEIGCGTGSTAIKHAQYVKHIHATDISPKMLGIARNKAEGQGIDNISFEEARISELDMPEASYDMVMAHSILHLLDHRDPVIRRVYRTLRPGALFVSSTACLNDVMKYWLLKPVLPVGRWLGLLPLVRFFSRADLRRSIENTGFGIEHDWRPGPDKAVFIVARKPGREPDRHPRARGSGYRFGS